MQCSESCGLDGCVREMEVSLHSPVQTLNHSSSYVCTMDDVQKVQELQRYKLAESCEERGPHEPAELVAITTTRTHATVSRNCWVSTTYCLLWGTYINSSRSLLPSLAVSCVCIE